MFFVEYVVEVLCHKGVGQSRYEAGDSLLGHVVKLDILQFKVPAPPSKEHKDQIVSLKIFQN